MTTENVKKVGATIYWNGTRIDCTHKGRPSVVSANRLIEALTALAMADDLAIVCETASHTTKAGLRKIEKRAHAIRFLTANL